jgi:hypothetical protein
MSFGRRAGYMGKTDSANQLLRWEECREAFRKETDRSGSQFWPLSRD